MLKRLRSLTTKREVAEPCFEERKLQQAQQKAAARKEATRRRAAELEQMERSRALYRATYCEDVSRFGDRVARESNEPVRLSRNVFGLTLPGLVGASKLLARPEDVAAWQAEAQGKMLRARPSIDLDNPRAPLSPRSEELREKLILWDATRQEAAAARSADRQQVINLPARVLRGDLRQYRNLAATVALLVAVAITVGSKYGAQNESVTKSLVVAAYMVVLLSPQGRSTLGILPQDGEGKLAQSSHIFLGVVAYALYARASALCSFVALTGFSKLADTVPQNGIAMPLLDEVPPAIQWFQQGLRILANTGGRPMAAIGVASSPEEAMIQLQNLKDSLNQQRRANEQFRAAAAVKEAVAQAEIKRINRTLKLREFCAKFAGVISHAAAFAAVVVVGLLGILDLAVLSSGFVLAVLVGQFLTYFFARGYLRNKLTRWMQPLKEERAAREEEVAAAKQAQAFAETKTDEATFARQQAEALLRQGRAI